MIALRLPTAYRDSVKLALTLQVPATLLLSLVLDDGTMARVGACVLAGFWIGAAVVMLRRPQDPRPLDLLYVKWGYAPLLLLGLAIAGAIVAHVR